MDVKIAPDWKELLAPEFEKPYFADLTQFVRQEYATRRIYPRGSNIFRAFDKCPFDKLKVVIIGQDPYHGPGQANGLCFSVGDGVPFPPSLQNIFKEVADDTGTPPPATGNLDRWAEQGVLLLNAVLTVRAHEAASHAGRGWETFTDAVVRAISERKQGVVYMLWGSYAQKKGAIADPQRNFILKSVHPSPLSVYRGFFGCRHFSRANEYLRSIGKEPIACRSGLAGRRIGRKFPPPQAARGLRHAPIRDRLTTPCPGRSRKTVIRPNNTAIKPHAAHKSAPET